MYFPFTLWYRINCISQNSYIEVLIPIATVLNVTWGHKGRALILKNQGGPYKKQKKDIKEMYTKTKDQVRTQPLDSHLQVHERGSGETTPAEPLLQNYENINLCWWSHSLYIMFLWQQLNISCHLKISTTSQTQTSRHPPRLLIAWYLYVNYQFPPVRTTFQKRH